MGFFQIPPCTKCRVENKLFCGLKHEDKESLSTNKDSNRFKSGQAVFYEGNRPSGLFCIYRGKVKLSKLGPEGKEQIVRFAGEGEMLGYRALLSGAPYNATATAIEDCEICHIPKSVFLSKLKDNSTLSFNVIKLLSENLKESEDKLISISQKTVRERVAQAILLLKTRFGLEEDNATLSTILTRREIGEIACITTETTIRTLSEFRKEKILELNQKKIKIIDMKKLVLAAKLGFK